MDYVYLLEYDKGNLDWMDNESCIERFVFGSYEKAREYLEENGFDSEVYICEEIRYYKSVFDWEDNGFDREYYKILKTEVN